MSALPIQPSITAARRGRGRKTFPTVAGGRYRRPLAYAAVTVLLASAMTACSARTRRTPDNTLVMLWDGVIGDLDPRFALGSRNIKLSRLLAPGLTTIEHPSLMPQPMLASELTQIDELTWEVRLRDDVLFSDGSPVRARDVVYTYESVRDPAVGSLHRKSFRDRFAKVEAIDEGRIRFRLQKPLATFLSDLDYGIVSLDAARRTDDGAPPSEPSETASNKTRAGGPDSAGSSIHRFAGGGVVGAGAYRIVSASSERLVLERNPHYFGPPPPMPRIEVRTVRDANARALMLVGGSADLAQNALRLDLVDAVASRARIRVSSSPSAILTYLMMQGEDPILSDVRVRQAIAYAIDRERIVAAKLGGRAVLASGLLPPSHWAYNPDVVRYDHDPARARALLDAAGYRRPAASGSDKPAEPRFRLVYKTNSDPFRIAIARIIASQLMDVGIEVEVRSFEFSTVFADIKEGNYQLASMQTAAITEPDYYYAYYHSSRIPSEENRDLTNRWRYRNPRIDTLSELGRTVADRERRLDIYREVQEILAREVPVVPLWHEDNVVVANVDVDDYEVLPNAGLGGLLRVLK